MRAFSRILAAVAVSSVGLSGCHHAERPSVQSGGQRVVTPSADSERPSRSADDAARAKAPAASESRLAAVKAKIMSADYRADFEGMASGREEAAPLSEDPTLGYLARYWMGYAEWRIAINGANHDMSREDLEAHLEKAASNFEASTRLKNDFADGYSAGSSVNGWLASFTGGDAAAFQSRIAESQKLLKRAKELDADNPRVLWVEAGVFLFTPPQYGGSPQRAIEIYTRAVGIAPPTNAASPGPDWGKPECLMGLAYTNLSKTEPDLASAERQANEALRLQPEWQYVRDILLPQIKTAAAKK